MKIRLQEQPFQVLVRLLERAGEVVTREELRRQLWPDGTFVDFDHSLNAAVNRLREALGDSAESPRFIETVPRRGYRFIAPVEVADGAKPAEAPKPGPAGSRGRWAAVVGVLLLLGLAYWNWQRPTPPAADPAQRLMLVVLPFENLSGDPEQEYFSEGLSEEITTGLGRLQPERLGVIARTSAIQYKGRQEGIEDIKRDLGVDYVLEGSVRHAGNRVRITTSLVQAADRTRLWTETYDREVADIFSVQGEVALSVARSLALELLPTPPSRAAGEPPTTPAAYEAYLKGRHFARQGQSKPALKYFHEAISLDPNFAPAYAGLANSLLFAPPALETMPRAREAALKALALEPSLPEAHSAVGLVKLMFEWDWEEAERAFQRALALDPSDPETHLRYSHYLAAMGRLDEAIAEARRAQRLDPLAPLPRQIIGRYLTFQSRLDEAIAVYQETLELDPHFYWGHLFISFVYARKGDYDRWLDHQLRAWRSSGAPEEVVDGFEAAYQSGGYEGAVRYTIAQKESHAAEGILPSAALALDYAGLGEKEKALYWLEKAYQNHTRDLIYLNVEPNYDSIRGEPRFQALLRRMNFPAN